MTPGDLECQLKTLNDIGTPDCKRWRNRIFYRHPSIARYVIPIFYRLAKRDGEFAANCWLRELQPRLYLGDKFLSIDADDDSIRSACERLAHRLSRNINKMLRDNGPAAVLAASEKWIPPTGVRSIRSIKGML